MSAKAPQTLRNWREIAYEGAIERLWWIIAILVLLRWFHVNSIARNSDDVDTAHEASPQAV